jgi:nickel-dependent lactate racemase
MRLAMEIFRPTPPPPNSAVIPQALAQALESLGGMPDLLVINDPQRDTRTEAVLARLRERGPLPSILVACGSHSFSSEEKALFHARFAPWVPAQAFHWHNAHAPDLVRLNGPLPWHAHPALAYARRILAVGSVEPHYFAGLSGGHKTLTIGVAGYADIEANHAHALDPACRPVRLAGNPVHEGIVHMLSSLTTGRSVAVVNLLECEGAIRAASGGPPLDALAALVPLVEQTWIRTISSPVDALILEVEGPLGESFYQAEKAIKNNEWAVRNGGALLLIASCSKGIGQAAFVRLLRETSTYDEARKAVQSRGYRLGDHKAVRLRYLTDPAYRHVQIYVQAPGLSEPEAEAIGVRKVASTDAFLKAVTRERPAATRARVLDAAFTFLRVEQTACPGDS